MSMWWIDKVVSPRGSVGWWLRKPPTLNSVCRLTQVTGYDWRICHRRHYCGWRKYHKTQVGAGIIAWNRPSTSPLQPPVTGLSLGLGVRLGLSLLSERNYRVKGCQRMNDPWLIIREITGYCKQRTSRLLFFIVYWTSQKTQEMKYLLEIP